MSGADAPRDPHALVAAVSERHAGGDGTERFDEIYAEAIRQGIDPPWAKRTPNPILRDWLDERGLEGTGRRALVVGCGLGDDAALLDRRGFATVAIDVSRRAIELARERFPGSEVEWRAANLLEPPEELLGAFAFVWEAYTLQSLPAEARARAMAELARLPAPGGTLLVAAYARAEGTPPPETTPCPLAPSELRAFERYGLEVELFESFIDEKRSSRPVPHHLVTLLRPLD